MAARIWISDSLPEKNERERMETKAMQANEVQAAVAQEYAFAGKNTEPRYRGLSDLYDASTIHYIEQCGIERGWSCLEVGAGGGSIASWLCARVGLSGRVLATDIELRFLRTPSHPGLEVRRHDIRSEALPMGEFDLAHARLVLMHLPDWQNALRKMVDALKPGGCIVIEEFDDLSFLPDPSINPRERTLKIRHAFQQVLAARGVNLGCGRLLPQEFQAIGLVGVGAEANVSMWSGSSAGTDLLKLSCQQLREPILASGLISQDEFEADLRRVDELDYLMPSPMMWTVWGRKLGVHSKPPAASDDFIYW